jgi:hypothetical protein
MHEVEFGDDKGSFFPDTYTVSGRRPYLNLIWEYESLVSRWQFIDSNDVRVRGERRGSRKRPRFIDTRNTMDAATNEYRRALRS